MSFVGYISPDIHCSLLVTFAQLRTSFILPINNNHLLMMKILLVRVLVLYF